MLKKNDCSFVGKLTVPGYYAQRGVNWKEITQKEQIRLLNKKKYVALQRRSNYKLVPKLAD